MVFDLVLILAFVLGCMTILVSVQYYRVLRRSQREYEKAKNAVEDMVLSFNRQFESESGKLEVIGLKVEAAASKGDTAVKTVDETSQAVRAWENRFTMMTEDKEELAAKVDSVDRKTEEILQLQTTLSQRLSQIEEQARQGVPIQDMSMEAAIPIRRDRALAPLTNTELSVLEFLVSEGPKTAPEIKERVKLSREHTARLMKKLYEGGYLERETNKIPFRYSVKREMEKLLKKTENQP